MKIAFLYVNMHENTGIPVGLSYLISILKNDGHEISLFETTRYEFDYTDFNMKGLIGPRGEKIIADFSCFMKKHKPALIAVSATSLCLNLGIKIIESLSDRPATIFGGVGPTVDYMNLIKNETIDYVCVGYGEECLPKLARSLEGGKMLEDIPNLAYKENKKIVKNEFSQSIDLANLPVPDWSLFEERHFGRIFKGEIKRWGNFQLARGCPFNCAYCINAYYHRELGMKIQKFPPGKIIDEIRTLSDRHGFDIVRIFDECFGFGNLEIYREFANLYKKTIKLPSIIETRPEVIRPEIVEILKDMNCASVSLGIEAGDETQRRKMLKRNVSNATIKRAFDLLREAGIRTSSYNIIGFPGDTREKIFATIKLNRLCRPDFINVFLFCADPKTELREYCMKEGLLETEAVVAYEERSVIKNNALTKEELYGLFRTFKYYVHLPERFYPVIEKAEKSGLSGNNPSLEFLEQGLGKG